MALTPGDYWRAIQDGVRQRSFSAARVTLAMTRQADFNMRALGVHPDQPKPEPKLPRLWVPLSDERQKVPPVEINARPEAARLRTEPTARKVAAREAMLQADAAPLGLNKMRASAHLLGQAAQERAWAESSETRAARTEHIHIAKDAIYDAINERRIHESQQRTISPGNQSERPQQTASRSAMVDRQTQARVSRRVASLPRLAAENPQPSSPSYEAAKRLTHANATAFVQKMLDDERKIHNPSQQEVGLKQKQEEGQKPKRQVVQ